MASCFHDVRRPTDRAPCDAVGQRCSGLRLAMRISTTTTSCATIRCWQCSRASSLRTARLRAGGRQVDAQPAGAEPPGADALSQDQSQSDGHQAAVRRLVPGAQERAPNEIILDLDATDDPVHGEQEGSSSTALTLLLPGSTGSRSAPSVRQLRARHDAAAGRRRRWPQSTPSAAELAIAWHLTRCCYGAAESRREINGVHFLFGLAKPIGSSPKSRPSLRGLRRRAGVPASRRGASKTSGG